ncbi:uncharacterized protein DUF3460 [Advenella incenata]|jgi:hypothetical protein|uniref:Uncharacterized protein DUF3460 n=1 Tax=Advenella incenata TaxID=267800 RepID=A0A4Q7VSU4_9BURK|nr:DUF3460 family protein [Advenella incenata]RZT99357.1 uncharacterized protein DUF3460 [Advenella incenata]
MAENFESDITKFIKRYKDEHPGTEERQRQGRGLLWDKTLDADLLDGFKKAKVPQKPYVYSNNS